jgi:alanyl-tRNA synthetase
LDIGSSRELCGGTHVRATGDIGLFKVTSESGVAAGVRRIEAVTGQNALRLVQQQQQLIALLSDTFKSPAHELASKVAHLLEQQKGVEKELAKLKSQLASAKGDELTAQAISMGDIQVLATVLQGADANSLRETMDKLKDKLKSAAIVLASVNADKITLVAGVTNDLISTIKAGDLVNHVATQVGGKGGGKPDLAMAGGSDVSKLDAALQSVPQWVSGKL